MSQPTSPLPGKLTTGATRRGLGTSYKEKNKNVTEFLEQNQIDLNNYRDAFRSLRTDQQRTIDRAKDIVKGTMPVVNELLSDTWLGVRPENTNLLTHLDLDRAVSSEEATVALEELVSLLTWAVAAREEVITAFVQHVEASAAAARADTGTVATTTPLQSSNTSSAVSAAPTSPETNPGPSIKHGKGKRKAHQTASAGPSVNRRSLLDESPPDYTFPESPSL